MTDRYREIAERVYKRCMGHPMTTAYQDPDIIQTCYDIARESRESMREEAATLRDSDCNCTEARATALAFVRRNVVTAKRPAIHDNDALVDLCEKLVSEVRATITEGAYRQARREGANDALERVASEQFRQQVEGDIYSRIDAPTIYDILEAYAKAIRALKEQGE